MPQKRSLADMTAYQAEKTRVHQMGKSANTTNLNDLERLRLATLADLAGDYISDDKAGCQLILQTGRAFLAAIAAQVASRREFQLASGHTTGGIGQLHMITLTSPWHDKLQLNLTEFERTLQERNYLPE